MKCNNFIYLFSFLNWLHVIITNHNQEDLTLLQKQKPLATKMARYSLNQQPFDAT